MDKNYLGNISNFIREAKSGKCNNKEYKLKWKSMVIRYIKVLSGIKSDDPNFNLCTDLLYRLFMLLEEAKLGNIFITSNPFKDINNDEVELYKLVLKRYFESYDDILTERMYKDIIDLSIINKRFLLWPIYLYSNEMIKINKGDTLYNSMRDNYKKYYKEWKKNGTNQLYLEYLMYNMVISAYLNKNMKKSIDFYYSYSVIDKTEAFNSLYDIASTFDDKQLFLYVYEDGVARRIKPTDEQKLEYDEIKIKK